MPWLDEVKAATRHERIDALAKRMDALEASLQETDEIAADLAEDVVVLEGKVDDLENPDEHDDDETIGSVAECLADLHAAIMCLVRQQAAAAVLANPGTWDHGHFGLGEEDPIHKAAVKILGERVGYSALSF